jgi:hypothetical protein
MSAFDPNRTFASNERQAVMRLTHTLENDLCDLLEVWVEPWADLYTLPRGSKISLSYEVSGEAGPLESKVEGDKLTFWFNGADEPRVSINGEEADSQDQVDWRHFKRGNH